LVTGQNEPVRIAIDDTNIYWVNSGEHGSNTGAVLKTSK
jgi:hypothetical protein